MGIEIVWAGWEANWTSGLGAVLRYETWLDWSLDRRYVGVLLEIDR